MGFDGARCCGVSLQNGRVVFIILFGLLHGYIQKIRTILLYTDFLINKSDCWVNIILIFYMFTFYSFFLI